MRTIAALGTAQTLAWASTYYLPAILARPIADDLGVSTTWVFAAFSGALLVSAFMGPWVGGRIDRHGGRPVLAVSNLVMVLGLVLLATASGPLGLVLAWLVLGVGMALGLYDAAFATLGQLHGLAARPLITGITLVAGFASTIGWPLSTAFEAAFGWRGTCIAWATLHLVLALPLNLSLPSAPASPPRAETAATAAVPGPRPTPPPDAMWLLALAFAMTWFVAAAMAAHLPRLLEAAGSTPVAAVAAAALVGPAQVAARLVEFLALQHVHPLLAARLATILHPLGAAGLAIIGAPGAVLFTVLHGAGNGLLTIAKGTVPLAIFGPIGYGQRLGWLAAPSRFAQALAPIAFGLLIGLVGAKALLVSAGLSLVALLALLRLQAAR